MAYRRPGVTVTQEFVGLVPALAAFALPSVTVGPAFQLVDEDTLGVYAAVETLYPYASLLGGAVVDLGGAVDGLAPSVVDPFPIMHKDITATLKSAKVSVLASQSTGAAVDTSFTDATDAQFANVVAGDIVRVVEVTDVEIVASRTDGATVSTTGQLNRLYAGTGNDLLFASVKAGDSVTVTTGGYFGTQVFAVLSKVGSNLLILDGDVNDGSGPVTTVNYFITGTRGDVNKGDYVVKSVTDDNTLVLQSPVPQTPETPLTYTVLRKVGDLVLDRVSSVAGNGFVASMDGVTLPATLTHGGLHVVTGALIASYRALRIDLANEVVQYVNVAGLNATFGVGQILPANPLAYGVSLMMQNTVTPVQGLGLDGNAIPNEALSYTAAADVLARGNMYAIALLTHNPVVHTLYKNHVEQMSAPAVKLERVVLFNSRLVDTMVLQEAETTTLNSIGARVVVGMQIAGSVASSGPKALVDSTAGQFVTLVVGDKVAAGDKLVVVSGTHVTPGTYTVASVTDANHLTTVESWVTGTASDVQYYIYRLDGLAAGGAKFYDRNAQFLSNGVGAGHSLTILAGAFAGRYRIASVQSEVALTITPAIISAVTSVSAVEYQIDRDLQKSEQADAIKGYSEAFASRRCVHVWPDQLQVPVGQQLYYVPGYFACSSIAGLVTGLPTQQGFTNLAISGFLGFAHSTRYFTEAELDNIADGGTMILAQDGPSQPLYIRHQLTTDRSAIKFQEFSITKNVDYIAKFLRTTFSKYIGQYNIVDTTMDALRATAGAAIKFLQDKTKVPKFGGVIRSGTLVSLAESTDQIDTVNAQFSFAIPVPLNNIDIVIEV